MPLLPVDFIHRLSKQRKIQLIPLKKSAGFLIKVDDTPACPSRIITRTAAVSTKNIVTRLP